MRRVIARFHYNSHRGAGRKRGGLAAAMSWRMLCRKSVVSFHFSSYRQVSSWRYKPSYKRWFSTWERGPIPPPAALPHRREDSTTMRLITMLQLEASTSIEFHIR